MKSFLIVLISLLPLTSYSAVSDDKTWQEFVSYYSQWENEAASQHFYVWRWSDLSAQEAVPFTVAESSCEQDESEVSEFSGEIISMSFSEFMKSKKGFFSIRDHLDTFGKGLKQILGDGQLAKLIEWDLYLSALEKFLVDAAEKATSITVVTTDQGCWGSFSMSTWSIVTPEGTYSISLGGGE